MERVEHVLFIISVQILNHYSKKGVEAKEILPVFPDFDVSETVWILRDER